MYGNPYLQGAFVNSAPYPGPYFNYPMDPRFDPVAMNYAMMASQYPGMGFPQQTLPPGYVGEEPSAAASISTTAKLGIASAWTIYYGGKLGAKGLNAGASMAAHALEKVGTSASGLAKQPYWLKQWIKHPGLFIGDLKQLDLVNWITKNKSLTKLKDAVKVPPKAITNAVETIKTAKPVTQIVNAGKTVVVDAMGKIRPNQLNLVTKFKDAVKVPPKALGTAVEAIKTTVIGGKAAAKAGGATFGQALASAERLAGAGGIASKLAVKLPTTVAGRLLWGVNIGVAALDTYTAAQIVADPKASDARKAVAVATAGAAAVAALPIPIVSQVAGLFSVALSLARDFWITK
jgi:hypothetical protein